MKTSMRSVTALLPQQTVVAIRREAAREQIRTGRRITISSFLRGLVEQALATPKFPSAVG